MENDRFNRLLRSSGTIVESRAIDSTPYLCLCLKLYLTIGVSTACCDRSFSKLKLRKYYLRSTMGESRLLGLAILSMESQFIKKLDFGDTV